MTVAEQISDGERELVGLPDRVAVDAWLDRTLDQLVGVGRRRTLFVAGRIDVVYAVVTTDDRSLLIKVHRPPVDLPARRLVARAQQTMADRGFPCARPLAGPVEVDGRVVSVETLLPDGERGDGHDPLIRRTIATGLAEHIQILAEPDTGLAAQVGEPPAWCAYDRGAWAASHMDYFDFRVTPPRYAWLQEFAQGAADRIVALRRPDRLVVCHADWYGGNLRFDGDRLVAAFDWDLMADTEPIVAGITAGMFSAGTAAAATPPTPAEAAAFLADYEDAVGRPFVGDDRSIAVAAACWSIAYTARCDVTQLGEEITPRPGSALAILTADRAAYQQLEW